MSQLIHCDGPGCDVTRDPDAPDMRRLGEPSWLKLERDGVRHDFHDDQCLANWTTGKPRVTAASAPCICDGAQVDPHTVAQHRPRPTTVTGR